MPSWVIWVIVAIVVIAALAAVIAASRKKKQEHNRTRAAELREQAAAQASGVAQREAHAKETEAKAAAARAEADRKQAEAERLQAEAQDRQRTAEGYREQHAENLRQADELDPDVNTKRDDYTGPEGVSDRGRDGHGSESDATGQHSGALRRAGGRAALDRDDHGHAPRWQHRGREPRHGRAAPTAPERAPRREGPRRLWRGPLVRLVRGTARSGCRRAARPPPRGCHARAAARSLARSPRPRPCPRGRTAPGRRPRPSRTCGPTATTRDQASRRAPIAAVAGITMPPLERRSPGSGRPRPAPGRAASGWGSRRRLADARSARTLRITTTNRTTTPTTPPATLRMLSVRGLPLRVDEERLDRRDLAADDGLGAGAVERAGPSWPRGAHGSASISRSRATPGRTRSWLLGACSRAAGRRSVRKATNARDRAGIEPERQLQPVRAHQRVVGQHVVRRAVGDHLPSWSTTDRGHSSRAYGRSWVTIRTVTSSERRMSASSRRDAGSRLEDGSSRTRISGSIASTVATATRRRWPKRRWCGGRSANSAIPTFSRASVTRRRARRPRSPRLAGPNADVLADRGHEQLVVGVLEATPTRRGSP